jgi:2-iminobutanoate/2-iminopropanoate deaminase
MKKIISTTKAPAVIGPYSQAVEINGILFVSGQIPIDPETGKLVEGGIMEQTLCVLRNLGAILEQAGYGYKDVVKSTCMLASISDFRAMNEVYSTFYTEKQPSRVTYAVKELPLGALIEIDAIAVK